MPCLCTMPLPNVAVLATGHTGHGEKRSGEPWRNTIGDTVQIDTNSIYDSNSTEIVIP